MGRKDFFWIVLSSFLALFFGELKSDMPQKHENQTIFPPKQSDPYYILTARVGAGMFAEFTAALGLLAFYEDELANKRPIGGLEINYGQQGLYWEKNRGNNWWNYYFDPIKIACSNSTCHLYFNRAQKEIMMYNLFFHISRQRAYELIQKYIKIKPEILRTVDKFTRRKFGKSKIIGVHYRGTDKKFEAPLLEHNRVYKAVRSLMKKNVRLKNAKIFLATDEQGMWRFMKKKFGKRFISLSMKRSSGNDPLHFQTKTAYQNGKSALVDCLLLSRCTYLIRTASYLSFCSTLFNPYLPNISLTDNRLHVEATLDDLRETTFSPIFLDDANDTGYVPINRLSRLLQKPLSSNV